MKRIFRKIELTNYTLGSDKVEKWSFYYLLGWNFWKSKRIEIEETLIERQEWTSLKQGEDGNLEIDKQCAYLEII